MAKKRGCRSQPTTADGGTLLPRGAGGTRGGAAGGTEVVSGRSVEGAALGFAEDLGRLLGTTQRKAEEWLGQRKSLAARLTQIRDAASAYLHQLSGGADGAGIRQAPARRGRSVGSKNVRPAAAKRKRAPISAEGRERIAAAQRARWAKQKRAAK